MKDTHTVREEVQGKETQGEKIVLERSPSSKRRYLHYSRNARPGGKIPIVKVKAKVITGHDSRAEKLTRRLIREESEGRLRRLKTYALKHRW